MIRRLKHDLDELQRGGQEIKLVWVPGHVEIDGNERADPSAKMPTGREPTLIPISYGNYIRVQCRKCIVYGTKAGKGLVLRC